MAGSQSQRGSRGPETEKEGGGKERRKSRLRRGDGEGRYSVARVSQESRVARGRKEASGGGSQGDRGTGKRREEGAVRGQKEKGRPWAQAGST